MRKNKFKLFASFLNKNGDHSEKKLFASPEEQAEYDKLDFLWNQCLSYSACSSGDANNFFSE